MGIPSHYQPFNVASSLPLPSEASMFSLPVISLSEEISSLPLLPELPGGGGQLVEKVQDYATPLFEQMKETSPRFYETLKIKIAQIPLSYFGKIGAVIVLAVTILFLYRYWNRKTIEFCLEEKKLLIDGIREVVQPLPIKYRTPSCPENDAAKFRNHEGATSLVQANNPPICVVEKPVETLPCSSLGGSLEPNQPKTSPLESLGKGIRKSWKDLYRPVRWSQMTPVPRDHVATTMRLSAAGRDRMNHSNSGSPFLGNAVLPSKDEIKLAMMLGRSRKKEAGTNNSNSGESLPEAVKTGVGSSTCVTSDRSSNGVFPERPNLPQDAPNIGQGACYYRGGLDRDDASSISKGNMGTPSSQIAGETPDRSSNGVSAERSTLPQDTPNRSTFSSSRSEAAYHDAVNSKVVSARWIVQNDHNLVSSNPLIYSSLCQVTQKRAQQRPGFRNGDGEYLVPKKALDDVIQEAKSLASRQKRPWK